ncbi:sodium:proton exchanger [Prolixibacteraceae bacterium JC049]|nr:sodium:proton exchanger [Prolixibacteraceae bacterium JC049]
MSSYLFIIVVCLVVITSFFFSKMAEKTRIPSVLMLMLLGVGLQQGAEYKGLEFNYLPVLEVLGIVGLIMIVLEAALDLKLSRKQWPTIWKSFVIGAAGLFISAFAFAAILKLFIQNIEWTNSFIYALPLSIMSSAIVIPSVRNLVKAKKEFMIYESTFSDILGIMVFYLLLQNVDASGVAEVSASVFGNVFTTVVVSVIVSYLLLFAFQFIKAEAKIFLFIAILVLLYSFGKLMHLSSLLIILVFGLILNNHHILIFNRIRRFFHSDSIEVLLEDFKMITAEASFLLRTLFFVVFGMSLALDSLLNWKVWIVSFLFLAMVYISRYGLFKWIKKDNVFPEALIAPRGLISVLLFFAIPEDFKILEFESGTLFVVILITSIVMAWALIDKRLNGGEEKGEVASSELTE